MIKWLANAVEYFQREQPHATTRWQAEQHQEREKACRAALTILAPPAIFIHTLPSCDHDFTGPEVEIENGSSRSCAKCGTLAITDAMRS